jgi:prepilin peptidase CpaA
LNRGAVRGYLIFNHSRRSCHQVDPGWIRQIMTFQTLPLTLFAVVMVAAAFEDFRRLIIPNVLPILLCAFWPVYYLAGTPSLYGALAAIGCALAVFVVGAALFARGWLGGGDVKLLSAATLWAGAAGTPALLMLTGLFGGALALFLLMPFGNQIVAATRTLMYQPPEPAARGLSVPVPYGVAISAAALIVILSPHIG